MRQLLAGLVAGEIGLLGRIVELHQRVRRPRPTRRRSNAIAVDPARDLGRDLDLAHRGQCADPVEIARHRADTAAGAAATGVGGGTWLAKKSAIALERNRSKANRPPPTSASSSATITNQIATRRRRRLALGPFAGRDACPHR